MGYCHVNKNLLPVKFTYFFELAAVSSLLPYLSVYMRSIGLTYSELSIIYGSSPFITAILRTLIGMLADKLQKHKQFLITCCVFSGLFHGFLLLTPRTQNPLVYHSCNVSVKLICSESGSLLEYCATSTDNVYINGNHTILTNPLVNISSCTTTCSVSNGTVPLNCFSESNHILALSQCNGSQSELSTFRISQQQLKAADVITYNPQPNYFMYPVFNFTYNGKYYSDLRCTNFNIISSCHMMCDGFFTAKPSVDAQCSTSGEMARFGSTFWVFMTLFTIGQIFFAPIFSLVDALVYNYLGKEAGKWGQQRLWGTVGFATFALISGFVMDSFVDLEVSKKVYTFLFAFILFSVLSIVGGVIVQFYKISGKIISTTLLTNFGQFLKHCDVLVLLCNTFIFGLYTGIIETFLFVRLFEIGASKLLMGICMLINCLPEVLILMSAGYLIRRIGIFGNICIVYTAYCIRLFVYAFLTSPWYTLLVEPLHSITFGLMYATVSYEANTITPPGMHGTIQSLIGALYFGFGKGTGSILSGQVYQIFGPKATFLAFAISAVICLAVYLLTKVLCLKRTKKEDPADIVTNVNLVCI
ncbi:hypothetical protein LSH36_54g05033 [Paralvinella palmiformis]|uniref:Major facilitator superfamily (MFS) profile domain-containing protein n=1 Tax=Paralvinella palmiformis TaxID=53620 RepID=A0AAD9NEC6_9ANNE|nr:hypothetical protein LSH36_54g05033 [Paralvinella palmiformis]